MLPVWVFSACVRRTAEQSEADVGVREIQRAAGQVAAHAGRLREPAARVGEEQTEWTGGADRVLRG